MALPASLAELISTKPKPRERLVSRSVTTVADSHVPTCANSDSSSALVVEKDRFPTKIFLPMALSCPFPGRLWFSHSCLSERPRSPRERRARITRKQEDVFAYALIQVTAQRPDPSDDAPSVNALWPRQPTRSSACHGSSPTWRVRASGVRGSVRSARHQEARGPLRSARLRLAARADEEAGGVNEVAVGPHPIEDALRDDDRKLRLERHRQLHEIERIGGQVVTQRDLGDQILDADAKTVCDHASNVRFHELLHTPPSRDRRHAP